MNNPWCQSYTGRAYYFLNPSPDDFEINAIATVLAGLPRFNRHSKWFYSVGQHSVLVSKLCEENPLGGLMHDVHEMYMTDLPTDLKHAIEIVAPGFKNGFTRLCDMADELICEKFGIDGPMRGNKAIKYADLKALSTEKRDIMLPPPSPWIELPEPDAETIQPMTEEEAKNAFLNRFYELTARS